MQIRSQFSSLWVNLRLHIGKWSLLHDYETYSLYIIYNCPSGIYVQDKNIVRERIKRRDEAQASFLVSQPVEEIFLISCTDHVYIDGVYTGLRDAATRR